MCLKSKGHQIECTLRHRHLFVADLKQDAQRGSLPTFCFHQHLTAPSARHEGLGNGIGRGRHNGHALHHRPRVLGACSKDGHSLPTHARWIGHVFLVASTHHHSAVQSDGTPDQKLAVRRVRLGRGFMRFSKKFAVCRVQVVHIPHRHGALPFPGLWCCHGRKVTDSRCQTQRAPAAHRPRPRTHRQ